MKHEIELKLQLAGNVLAALKRHPLVQNAPKAGNAATLENTYYDTPELALKANGVALRTRRHGRTSLQTIKAAGISTGGLTSRPEWEQAFSGTFDFAAVDVAHVRKLLMRHAPRLVPIFTTRFRRETRVAETTDGARILMMFDSGSVEAGGKTTPIRELELELDHGEPLDLLRLACELAHDVALLPSDVSKAERGYRLHLGTTPAPAQAEPAAIAHNDVPLDAFRALAFSCVRQWQANVSGAMISDEPEFLHQLRISQRRLRSLLRLFAPALPEAFVTQWGDCLRTNAARFAATRDLDVLHDEILAPVTSPDAAEDAALARLRAAVLATRSRSVLQPDVATQGRLLLEFTAALHALRNEDAHALRDFARARLSRLRKKGRRRLRAARSRTPNALHALRISVKQLRYAVEFLAPLVAPKALVRELKALTRAQRALGFVNDLDVARGQLAALTQDDPELRAAAAFTSGWHATRYVRLSRRAIRELEPTLRRELKLKKAKPLPS